MPPSTHHGSRSRVRPSADAESIRRLAARRGSSTQQADASQEEPLLAGGEQAEAPLGAPVLAGGLSQALLPVGDDEEAQSSPQKPLPVDDEEDWDEEEPPSEPGEAGEQEEGRRRRPLPRLLVPLLLAVVTLAAGGLAAWFGTQAGTLTGASSAQNLALSDPGETSQVVSQATSAVDALFSFNYAAPDPTTQAASRLLTGAAVKQYASLFAQVEKEAPAQKLVVTTAVTSAGVELLTANTARVLVYATESDSKAGGTPAAAGAMLAVNLVRAGGTWKIAGIDTFR